MQKTYPPEIFVGLAYIIYIFQYSINTRDINMNMNIKTFKMLFYFYFYFKMIFCKQKSCLLLVNRGTLPEMHWDFQNFLFYLIDSCK